MPTEFLGVSRRLQRDKNDPDIVLDDEGRKWHNCSAKCMGRGRRCCPRCSKASFLCRMCGTCDQTIGETPSLRGRPAVSVFLLRHPSNGSPAGRENERIYLCSNGYSKTRIGNTATMLVYGGLNKAVQIDFEFFPIFFLEPNVYAERRPTGRVLSGKIARPTSGTYTAG